MCAADLPTARPTRLPQVNHRLGSTILLRHLLVIRHARVGSPEGSPLAQRFGLGADMVVPEYQPVVHRLRLSASP
jgi:hypothetical protein